MSNVYFELFLGVPTFLSAHLRAQVGAHADVSLSSIWPGDVVLPLVFNGFVGWSPADWLSLRLFYGAGGTPMNIKAMQPQFGLRAQVYLP